jgi:predicted ester cyclase
MENRMQASTLAQTNKAIALRFAEEGWGTEPRWQKVWDEVMAPNVIQHFNSWSEPIVGLEANKQFNIGLFQGFPDIKQTIEDVIADGDKVVFRSTLEGTNTGEFLGIPPTGKSAKMNDFTLLRFENGKIVEWWYETNLLELMNQLGLSNSPN